MHACDCLFEYLVVVVVFVDLSIELVNSLLLLSEFPL